MTLPIYDYQHEGEEPVSHERQEKWMARGAAAERERIKKILDDHDAVYTKEVIFYDILPASELIEQAPSGEVEE